MDLANSRKPEALADRLERDPSRFEPVTALRIAQSAAAGENVDIRSHGGVSPAPLAVSDVQRKGGRISIRTAFAGLVGPLGSLPSTYNETIMREERNRSRALSAFFDMFGARMAELFADASEKYRLARRLRWNRDRKANAFVTTLRSLSGFGTRRLVERSGVDEDLVLRFSGFFSARNRNAVNLRAMLTELTGLPVEIELFRGRWLSIPIQERSRMGAPQGVQLGVNATAGASIHDFSGGFRVVIGPVGYSDYLSLSPGGRRIAEISALSRLYIGSALDFDIQIILSKEDIPFCRVGQDGDPPRLGWNSWARVAPAERDSADAVIVQPLAGQG